jgi:hypothetical protein
LIAHAFDRVLAIIGRTWDHLAYDALPKDRREQLYPLNWGAISWTVLERADGDANAGRAVPRSWGGCTACARSPTSSQARRAEISDLAAEKRTLVQAAASQLINTEIARLLGITLARVDQILKPRYPKRTA